MSLLSEIINISGFLVGGGWVFCFVCFQFRNCEDHTSGTVIVSFPNLWLMEEYRQLHKCGCTYWSLWKFLHINLLNQWLYDRFYCAANAIFAASMTHTIIHWDLWSFCIEVKRSYQCNTGPGVDKVGTDENEITPAKDESDNKKYKATSINLILSAMKRTLLCLEKAGIRALSRKVKAL